MSPIPDTSREAFLEAMARFDREDRASTEWQEWESGRYGAHKFAIAHDGRLYPVKRIVAMARGVSYRTFSGGDELNEQVRRLGLNVVSLRERPEPRVWWVNQGQFYDVQRGAGQVEAPTRDAGGGAQRHWSLLAELEPGDLLVHYVSGQIRALGRVQHPPQVVTLSDGREARRAPVEYYDLEPSVPFSAIGPRLTSLQIKHGPLIASGERPKEGYLWRFSPDGLRIIWEASEAEWPDWAEAAIAGPRAWIFQANPDQYEVTAAIRELTEIHWPVRQHGDEIQPGHRVFIWVSGADAGIVAIGTVLTAPAPLPPDEAESRFSLDAASFQGVQLRVRLSIDEVLADRLRRSALREHAVLRDLSIVQLAAQGTNFAVTPHQAIALLGLVAEHVPPVSGSVPPMLTADSSATVDFETLLETFDDQGLHFPPELVANYLLALQTKRFVILTGISGTGKTQLAMAVAQAFRPRVRMQSPRGAMEGASEQQVLPYMVKYHRMTLPSALRANLTLPALDPEKNSSLIDVLYPAGRTPLRFYKDPDRPVVELLFSGEFRSWFEANLQVGDHFQLDVVASDVQAEENVPDCIRFSLPVTESREEDLDNYRVVAVRPDWTDNRGLLGYHNPLTERYATTPFLDLLLRANEEFERARREGNRLPYPFFVILDEMNLAHVEHYFSDFLSAMESGEKLDLHGDVMLEAGGGAEGIPVPMRLDVPPNVFFTGTVNIDETTAMFSPKVLDRAFTIELDQVDLDGYGLLPSESLADTPPGNGDEDVVDTNQVINGSSTLGLTNFPGSLEPWRKPIAEDWQAFGTLLKGELRRVAVELHDLLARSHRHFGYRVANEIARFVLLAADQASDSEQALSAAFDLAILEKVLPKFHGTQQELEAPLRAVFSFLVAGSATGGSPATTHETAWVLHRGRLEPVGGIDGIHLASPALPRSAAKVWRMLERLKQQGFTSYIE